MVESLLEGVTQPGSLCVLHCY